MGTGYLTLDGTSGCYANTPDSAGVSVTGDIDLRAKVAPVSWGGVQKLICKVFADRAYDFYLNSTQLTLEWRTAAGVANFKSSGSAVPFANGAAGWVRVTLDVDNGAGGFGVQFYTSTDGVTWTPLGSLLTGAGTTDIKDTTEVVAVGADSNGTSSRLTGKFYSAEVRNGINGTIVASPDFTVYPANVRGFADAQGNVWTLRGTATLAADASSSAPPKIWTGAGRVQ